MQSISSLIKDALSIYMQNIKVFLLIVLVPAVLSGIAAFFEPEKNEIQTQTVSAFFLIATILSIAASLFMTLALIHKGADTTLDAKAAYQKGAGQFLKYILFAIVLTLILVVAFVLLIIPGIWLSVSFSFAMFFLLLENQSIVQSLRSSFNLVKGKWWGVLGRSLILGLLSIAFVIVLELLGVIFSVALGVDGAYALKAMLAFLLTPFSILYMYLLFKDLQSKAVQM